MTKLGLREEYITNYFLPTQHPHTQSHTHTYIYMKEREVHYKGKVYPITLNL